MQKAQGPAAARPSPEEWRRDAWEAEAPLLAAQGRAALEAPPAPEALRRLSVAARALAPGLDAAGRARALERVRAGLAAGSRDEVLWDALVVAADLGLQEARPEIERVLWKEGPKTPFVRGMAAFALPRVAPVADARAVLEKTRRDDPSWIARNLASEALSLLDGRPDPTPPLFSRFGWLQKTTRSRTRSAVGAYGVEKWLALGVALPPAVRLFYAQVMGGGTVDLLDEGAQGAVTKRGQFILRSPEDAPRAGAALDDLNDYVWARYVDMAKTYPKVDEEQALRRYAERYDDPRRPLDRDAWAYGVLLFERAFHDEGRRAERLLRAREVLEGTIAVTGERDWEVTADRLAEARDLIEREGLAGAARVPRLYPLARIDSVELLVDAARAGAAPILGRRAEEEEQEDDDELVSTELREQRKRAALEKRPPGDPIEVETCFAAWINDPRGMVIEAQGDARPVLVPSSNVREGTTKVDVAAAARAAVEAEKDPKRRGRQLLDALEQDSGRDAVATVAEFLGRPALDPVLVAELLGELALGGDRDGEKRIGLVLAALEPKKGQALLDALEKLDRAGGGETSAARLVDVISGLRPKKLEGLRDRARAIRERRGEAQLRTVKNKWYKPFKKGP